MGSLANSLFQFFLGWIRILFSSLWESVTSPSRGSLLGWIGEHWLALLICICVFGAVTDLVVYLFRWRPYRVWASFFRQMRKCREEKKAGLPEKEVLPEEAYEDSDVSEVSFRENREGDEGRDLIPQEESVPRAWTWDEPESVQQNNPVMPAAEKELQAPGIASGEKNNEGNPGVTARFDQALRPRRRRTRMKDLFSEEGPQSDYTAPQELIDRREAYYRPVYPRNWKGNNDSES